MRIRKHAKVSPLLYSPDFQHGTVLQTTICQLNQSPWDIVTFSPDTSSPFSTTPPPPPPPPPLHQVEEEDRFIRNGSFYTSIGALESVSSMKLSFDNDVAADDGGCVEVEMEEAPREEAGKNEDKDEDEEEVFCLKIDSKGWQCHRIAKSEHIYCEQHLYKMNKNNNGSNYLAKENGCREIDKYMEHGRGRRAKKGSGSGSGSGSNDPNEYYYYSGFGPRWGKRRGQFSGCNNSSSGNSGNDETNIEGGEVVASNSSRIGYGELDYMVEEEEEDDDEEDDGGSGKKRARKPVKARSLKSLM